MKLLAFGATGSVGRELVEQALEQGHSVTAFVRDPAKLGIAHPELQIFQGDALDPASVEAAVRGQQAVLCALGAGRKGVCPFRRDAKYHQHHGESGCQTAHLSDHTRCRRQ